MTVRFFCQSIKTHEDTLIKAMDVAGDCLTKDYGSRKAKQQAKLDLELISR